jgi:hypothetical protein
MAQQFESLANKILNDFENEITITDFNVSVSYKFFLHNSQNTTYDESMAYIVPTKMGLVPSENSSAIYYFYNNKLASKNLPTYTEYMPLYCTIIKKLNKAKYGIRIGNKFYEDQKIM